MIIDNDPLKRSTVIKLSPNKHTLSSSYSKSSVAILPIWSNHQDYSN